MCKLCSVEGCNKKHKAKGYCQKHYDQFRKYGYIPEKTLRSPSEIIKYEDCAEIVLCNKQGEEVARAIIDLDDVDKCSKYRWGLQYNYVYSSKAGYLHRFVINYNGDLEVDHIDRNSFNNCKSNLRVCTHAENLRNRGYQSGSTTKLKGVYFIEDRNKYMAQIYHNGKFYKIGYFNTAKEAAIAYNNKAIDFFGEFAFLNDINNIN
jgi:hypothetical protein